MRHWHARFVTGHLVIGQLERSNYFGKNIAFEEPIRFENFVIVMIHLSNRGLFPCLYSLI